MRSYRHADGASFRPGAYAILVSPLTEEDSGGWFARIPDLPGCMGDGETEAEAIADVRSAALCWADGMVERGDDIPWPRDHVHGTGEPVVFTEAAE